MSKNKKIFVQHKYIIAKLISGARELIEDAHHRYATNHRKSLIGLWACKLTDEGQVSTIPLLLDWDDIRVELQKRNKKLTNLRKRFVTGIIKTNNEWIVSKKRNIQ
jgi:hypothetical protein